MSSLILFTKGTPKTRFIGTRVSGRKTTGLKQELGTYGVSITFVSRGTLSSELLQLRMMSKSHDGASVGHIGVVGTLAKAFN
jgi:hypothetical protein